MLHHTLQDMLASVMHARHIEALEVIQSLWSGYGEIVRLQLHGSHVERAILKHVKPPSHIDHPRGWHSDTSHQRKLTSYAVEMHWYTHQATSCDQHCRVPLCYWAKQSDDEYILLLEDLDAAGFSIRRDCVELSEVCQCLRWLAHFHARFLGVTPKGLWQYGSYWHLDTRQDELAAMQNKVLQRAAPQLDQSLKNARYQTLIHGDAKLADFCFADDGQSVAAVDFQYVGGGCGMKDVAYFLGSCLSDAQCKRHIEELLDDYFNALEQAVQQYNKQVDIQALEAEWRELFPVAWVDFYRFLDGWMPNHWKINSYTRALADQLLSRYACTA